MFDFAAILDRLKKLRGSLGDDYRSEAPEIIRDFLFITKPKKATKAHSRRVLLICAPFPLYKGEGTSAEDCRLNDISISDVV